MRWSNLLFLAVLVWLMNQWVAVPVLQMDGFGAQLPWYTLALLIAATVLIAAGGYVVNDYFDVKIDRINRPDLLIVTRTVSREGAMRLSLWLSACGVVCGLAAAMILKSMTIALVIVIVPGLLWFYSASYKRLLLIGNLVIALLAAMPPMLVALANVAQLKLRYQLILPYTTLEHDLYAWLGGFALFAFLLTWIREIIKDAQDIQGDREMECHTMPVVWGETGTKLFVSLLVIATLALIGWLWWAVLPFPHSWMNLSTRYIVLGVVVPLLGAWWLLWAAKIPGDYKTCQQVVKLVMLLGMLYSFVIARYLA